MTRAELLKYLTQLQAAGADMELPLVIRVNRKVEDKRTSRGTRDERLWASITSVYHSTLSFQGDHSHGDALSRYAREVKSKYDDKPYYVVGELNGQALTDFHRG